jgi:hypothetical protein
MIHVLALGPLPAQAKLAKLRREILAPSERGAGGGGGSGFDVTKSGDSRVGLVGFPSVGKSTLLNKLTGTFSEVASYEFTTLTCVPGVIRYRGAKIQVHRVGIQKLPVSPAGGPFFFQQLATISGHMRCFWNHPQTDLMLS